jgi:hypothetical protein
MTSKFSWISGALLLFLLISSVFAVFSPALADSQPNPTAIVTPIDTVDGISTVPARNSFYAEGRYWLFYLNHDTDLVYTSSATGLTGE